MPDSMNTQSTPSMSHGIPGAPGAPGSAGDDPDAHGLPPGVLLPEPHGFRRDQLRARLVVCTVVLVVLGLLTFWTQGHRWLYGGCTAVAGVATMVLLVRYLMTRRLALRHHQSGRKQEKTEVTQP